MVFRPRTITNGQRAAVCALVIAGQPFIGSCKMLGIPSKAMLDHLPEDWRGRHVIRHPNRKWKGERLAQLKLLWDDLSVSTAAIAEQFEVDESMIRHVALVNRWPRRPLGAKSPLPVPISKMDPEQAARYRKLARILGRSAAVQAVFG